MERREKEIIDRMFATLVEDLIPVDMLPYLSQCLTQTDREYVVCTERNLGNRRAASTLLELLKRKRDGFAQLLRALWNTGCRHLVQCLVRSPGTEDFVLAICSRKFCQLLEVPRPPKLAGC